MSVEIKEEGGGMLKPRDTITRERGICGALNRHFCQTRVNGSLFSPSLSTNQKILFLLFCLE